MTMEAKKEDTTKYLKNIEQAAEEVATWPKAKLENAKQAFSEPMPAIKPHTTEKDHSTPGRTPEAQL